MDIPTDIRLPLCIEQGKVFNFYIDFGDGKRESKNRYFVVLNSKPKSDVILIMITSTTKIDKKISYIKKVGIDESTLVIVSKKEYPTFTQESAFNCNDIFQVKMGDLIKKLENGGSDNFPVIPNQILKKLIQGVKNSPNVEISIKDLL
ncbi:MAG: hypothetical protein AAB683_00845 [Patescibacteria group bacterium]